MLFKSVLKARIEQKKNQICVGLDLHLNDLPDFFRRYAEEKGACAFAKRWGESLIYVAKEYAPALKFQSSFFERLGSEGFSVLKHLMHLASDSEIISILDVKRCDIASTMKAYGESAFDELKADAMTVISYMGLDVFRALYPWMERGKGVYSVFISSNPTGFYKLSSHYDSKRSVAEFFHQDIFNELEEKNLSESLGLVVGFQSYEACSYQLRHLKKKYPLLLPGLGFQGGKMSQETKELCQMDEAHLFPVSRSLSALGDLSLTKEMEEVRSFNAYEDFLSKKLNTLIESQRSLFF